MGDKTGTETTPVRGIPFTIAAPLAKDRKKSASGRDPIKKIPKKRFARLKPKLAKVVAPPDPVEIPGEGGPGEGGPGEGGPGGGGDGTHHTRSRRKQSPAQRKAAMKNLQKARAALKRKHT